MTTRWRYRLNPPVLAQASEMHDTNVEAAAALGVSAGGFAKACKRHGIESPAERKKRIYREKRASWMLGPLRRMRALLSRTERVIQSAEWDEHQEIKWADERSRT